MQNAIDRNEYKNKSRNREYYENRRRENEVSREKIKKFKNNNFIDFSKIICFECRQKNIMFAIASFLHSLTNRKKKLINIVSIVSTQIVKNKNALHHFFILMMFNVNIITITIKAIIDNKIIYHFIF